MVYVVVSESQITQSLKVRDLGGTFDQFLNFNDHIFILETLETLGICYRIMNVLLLFMHLLDSL